MDKVGKDGVITVEEANGTETTLGVVEGMEFNKGYLSPHFINNPEGMNCVLDNPLILSCEKKISNLKDLLPILEKVSRAGKPLLIVAEDVDNEAFKTLVLNRLNGSLNVVAVKAPSFGDRKKAILEDIAILTGGKFVTDDAGLKLENLELEDLGSAKRVVVSKDDTTIIEGEGGSEAMAGRISQIRRQVESSTSDFDKESLQERLAKLSGGVAVIHVGASTETEMKEKKDRVDDALHATRAAVEEGIVSGGGVALIKALKKAVENNCYDLASNDDEKTGMDIVSRAIEAPLRQLATNAGKEGALIVDKVKESNEDGIGYNVATDTYENLIEAGVVDPTKVTRSALQHASSIAGLLLSTECLITEEVQDSDE